MFGTTGSALPLTGRLEGLPIVEGLVGPNALLFLIVEDLMEIGALFAGAFVLVLVGAGCFTGKLAEDWIGEGFGETPDTVAEGGLI